MNYCFITYIASQKLNNKYKKNFSETQKNIEKDNPSSLTFDQSNYVKVNDILTNEEKKENEEHYEKIEEYSAY